MSRRLIHHSASQDGGPVALPGLRPGVMLVPTNEEAELRDNALGQVIKLGEAAAVIVQLLDGNRDAAAILEKAEQRLGGPLDPMGLVDLLQALDQRALLDTPRARAIVSQGLIRADVATLRILGQRGRAISNHEPTATTQTSSVRMAPNSHFSCNSCTRCCTDQHLLGPVSAEEVKKIISGFKSAGKAHSAGPADFMPLPNDGEPPVSFLLRTQNGRCHFLQDNGLCGIHQELGIEYKPAVCRLFPFRPVNTPTGWDVGLSLSCPTVASDLGDDPHAEAVETITTLAKSSPLLQVISDTVQLDSYCKVPYEIYREWEEQAMEMLLANPEQPGHAWVEAVTAFETLRKKYTKAPAVDPWLDLIADADTQTMEMESKTKSDELLSERGHGELSPDVGRAADILLRDLAIWLELLVGLEAADPMALRRTRKGFVRLRGELNVSPAAPAVLAERARLTRLSRNAADTLEEDESAATQSLSMATRPSVRSVKLDASSDQELGLRFLCQALIGKSLFRFSSVRHGLLGLTMHLALLRLEGVYLDPMSPDIADISYVFQHPQFTDVIDSRAVVRHHHDDGSIHRSILGISLSG